MSEYIYIYIYIGFTNTIIHLVTTVCQEDLGLLRFQRHREGYQKISNLLRNFFDAEADWLLDGAFAVRHDADAITLS
jgi:hypothetical protein